jgi:hypothetical protein
MPMPDKERVAEVRSFMTRRGTKVSKFHDIGFHCYLCSGRGKKGLDINNSKRGVSYKVGRTCAKNYLEHG